MRSHPSRADTELASECQGRGLNVTARVIQNMKERGALRPPISKVSSYPKGTWKTVYALIRCGWQRKAKRATFFAFFEGQPIAAKGVRWSLTPKPAEPQAVEPVGDETEFGLERAREEKADRLAADSLESRRANKIALRKMLRSRGVDPSVAANDLSLAISGGIPPVDTRYYEPKTGKVGPAPMPWLFNLLESQEEESGKRPEEEWADDPQAMASEVQDHYAKIAELASTGSLIEALAAATEEQLVVSRDQVREALGGVPHLSRTDFDGVATAFLFVLALVVETGDVGPDIEIAEGEGGAADTE